MDTAAGEEKGQCMRYVEPGLETKRHSVVSGQTTQLFVFCGGFQKNRANKPVVSATLKLLTDRARRSGA